MSVTPLEPVLWSIAGVDSEGCAGLAADQRAADAARVHLCPVATALTAQRGPAVEPVMPVPARQLDAVLAALAETRPPVALKTGLLGGVEQLRVVTRWIDRLRAKGPLAVVVDPLLPASSDAAVGDPALLRAYREELLPRASVVTPNRREAALLLALAPDNSDAVQPGRARALTRLGAAAVVLTGGDAPGAMALDRMVTPHAEGWLALPRRSARVAHGAGCVHATALAAALGRGFVAADAAVLAKMLAASGLHSRDHAQGAQPGPVHPIAGFARDRSLLPALFDGDVAPSTWPRPVVGPAVVEGVYAISDSAAHAAALFDAGLRTVQLRLKRTEGERASAWQARLHGALRDAHGAARRCGAMLIVNDHWREAVDLGIGAVHLGQEDLLALDGEDRLRLARARENGLRLGVSSHSLWELARAVAWAPDYIACGPVWPTTTKAMPWRPQGLGNLRWWVAMAPAPVVGIGGVLEPSQLTSIAHAGAAAGCVVRALRGADNAELARWLEAWPATANGRTSAPPEWPSPPLYAESEDAARQIDAAHGSEPASTSMRAD